MHEEKSHAASEEEKEGINFPTYFSNGDKVDEQMQTILDVMDPIDPLTMDDSVMAERIHYLVRRTLNKCSEEDSDQSDEEPIALENGHRPSTSRLPSAEATTPIAKSTFMVQEPQRRSVHFLNLEEIREKSDMTKENPTINLKFDQPSEEALGLFLSMHQQFDPLNQYDYKSQAPSTNPPMEVHIEKQCCLFSTMSHIQER